MRLPLMKINYFSPPEEEGVSFFLMMNTTNTAFHQTLYRNVLLTLMILLILFGYSGCGREKTEQPSSESSRFSAFTKRCFREYVSKDTVDLHFKLTDPSQYGISGTESSFRDLRPKAKLKEAGQAASLLKELHSFDREKLTPSQQLTWDIFDNKLTLSAAGKDYLLYPTLLGTNGLPSQIPVTLSEYYFRNEDDVKDYLALLAQLPLVFEQLISYEKARMDAGFSYPPFVIEHTVDQMEQFIKGSEEDNLLIETFRDRINAAEGLSEDQKKTYISNNQALFRDVVIPSYRSLKETLSSWKNTDPKKERLCQYPQGKDYYQFLLNYNVGTDKSPEDCIALLEKQLKGIIADITDLNEGFPDLYTEYLSSQPVLTDPEDIFEQLEADCFVDFPPIETVNCSLKELPLSLSGTSAAAFYLVPPIDAENDNIIYINKNRVGDKEMFSTLAHEGYPGHLYQTNYYLKKNEDPLRFVLRTSGYDEGWGTYAQIYSYHYMEFKDKDEKTTEVLRQLYADNDLLSLILSSLSDLYVNYKNYDKEKLAAFLSKYQIDAEHANSVYEYVVENPTGYLTYCLGYYELKEAEENEKKEESDQFDLISFHKKVLDCGSCPFEILKRELKKK